MSLPKEIYNNANKPIKSITDHLNSAVSQAAIKASQKLSEKILKSGLSANYVPKLGSELKSTINKMIDVLENFHNLQTAVETYQKANKTGLDSTVQESLKSAKFLMKNAFKRQYWEDVELVYDEINQAIETLLQLQSRQQDKEIWLKEIQGLAVQAAYALAKNDKLPAAVMTIEQGLARLFSDSLKHYRFEDIQEAAKEQPLVYLMTTELGGLALLLQDSITPVWLPELTQNSSKLRYLEAYFQWRQSSIKTASSQKAFLNRLEDTTHWLWHSVMQPLMAALSPHLKIILIPVGQLSLLPFHAAWTEDNTAITGKRYALNTLTMAYVPNARIWIEARKRLERVSSLDSLLAVEAPEPVKASPLPNAKYEIKTIASTFNHSQILAGQAATRDAVLNAMKNNTVLHFACHGYFEAYNPLKSGLVMANDQFLSLEDLLTLPDYKARLVTLSACETGISDITLPDEAISLSTGFLQAGAASVVASFWDVFDDTLSMMIMIRFYALWRQEGLEPVEALRQAQLWMRDSTNGEKLAYFQERADGATLKRIRKTIAFSKREDNNFAHSFYWATFIYVGV
ncbi:MAG: CHAT domain-containing protein [Candidatus Parabeggiatoa sp.]|nr:CHAT domain-containing protein [Candidatus Parabeggiatoa sp.]